MIDDNILVGALILAIIEDLKKLRVMLTGQKNHHIEDVVLVDGIISVLAELYRSLK